MPTTHPSLDLILYHNLLGGLNIGASGVSVPSDVAKARDSFPAIITARTAMDIAHVIYGDQDAGELVDLTGASGALKAWPLGSPLAAVTLASGASYDDAGGGVYAVPKDTLDPSWAAYRGLRLFFDITVSTRRLVLWQDIRLQLVDDDPDADDYPSSEYISLSTLDIDAGLNPTYTLPDIPGYLVVRVDTTDGDCVLTLSDAAAYNGTTYLIVKTAAANTLTVQPPVTQTINGLSSYFLSGLNDSSFLIADGANWHHPNFTQVLT